ncbi:MAG: Acb2/Tad1 domain-containing protein [Oryzihumus sp.]
MRDLESALDQFAYHPATDVTAPKHAQVRSVLMDTVRQLWTVVPDGPEKTLAMRALQEAGMYANLAIALSAAVDDVTPHVARVLPS